MRKKYFGLFSHSRYLFSNAIVITVLWAVLLCVYADTILTGVVFKTTPETLFESDLDGAVISLKLTNGQFASALSVDSFELIHAPPGLSIASIKPIDSESIDIILAFNQMDFDENTESFAVKVSKECLADPTLDLSTEPILIQAIIEKDAALTAEAVPAKLSPSILNGAVINLTLSDYNFKNPFNIEDYLLNNAPIGTIIDSVQFIDYRHVVLKLKFSGSSFEEDITDFSILAVVNNGLEDIPISSNNLTISGDAELVPQSLLYDDLAKSYPIKIDIMGFNSRDGKLYLYIEFKTYRNFPASQRPIFNYFIEVYNGSGTLIGAAGSYNTPLRVSPPRSYGYVVVKNVPVSMHAALDASMKINVIVKNVSFMNI